MKLSKRLESIASLVDYSILADVGSDHGKLIIYLAENNRIEKGYAIENKIGPYNRLSNAINNSGLTNIFPIYSDGISSLDENVQTVVIAGMGGLTIVEILKSHPERLKNVNTLIIDAHNASSKVRKEINSLGYKIDREIILQEDGLYYEIIKFIKGEENYDELDYEFGPLLRKEKSETFIKKYRQEIDDMNNLLNNSNLPSNRKEELINRINLINKVI